VFVAGAGAGSGKGVEGWSIGLECALEFVGYSLLVRLL